MAVSSFRVAMFCLLPATRPACLLQSRRRNPRALNGVRRTAMNATGCRRGRAQVQSVCEKSRGDA